MIGKLAPNFDQRMEQRMGRVKFVQYKGISILIEDFSNLYPGKEFLDTIAAARALIASQPPKSVLALLDATSAHYDTEILAAMKGFVKANGPYIKCAVVVGISGLANIALTTLTNVSGRSFRTFSDRQSAMEYLIRQ